MIRITAVPLVSLVEVTFLIAGDAALSVFSFDVTRAPFNLDFRGNAPVALSLASYLNGPTGTTMTATISRNGVVTLTFSAPLPNGPAGVIDILFSYGGLA
jgi:hypothetical protein